MKKSFSICCLLALTIYVFGQIDSTKLLPGINVTEYKTVNGVGHFADINDGIIYAGKKNEVIFADSLDANKAINNTRQILGRVPGLNIVETESSGFTANGIATRGLNPIQSTEMNSRQNGYNISADVYGYNESYYIPPMEAVSRIELVRGAAALQFGAHFGGLVNYVLKEAPTNKKVEFNTAQTAGSFGLFNSFNSIGGTCKKVSYYGYVQYRNMDGYRPNSQQWQLSGFGKVKYTISQKVNIGIEYSLLRNRIQMPGGLTDEQFAADPKLSTRARNWLKSPWNIITATFNFNPTDKTSISLKSSFLYGNRSLVWRDEDGGPAALDIIDTATNAFVPREVGIQQMQNINNELRVSHRYRLGKQESVLSSGIRGSYAWFKRRGGGKGTTNSDFDLSISGEWGYNLEFTTTNISPFVENLFRITKRFSITPGFRFEYLHSTSNGYKIKDGTPLLSNESRTRLFPVFGIALEYKSTKNTSIYGNVSQAYKPINYSQLQPFGTNSVIDPKLKDAFGYNADIGYRGTIKNFLNFDIGGFYMAYNRRIGVVLRTDATTGKLYSLRTNIANSVHLGLESYIEFNLLKCIHPTSKFNLSMFYSLAYIDAKYTTGEFKGNRVEASAAWIERAGIIFSNAHFSTTLQVNYVGDAFGDASNVRTSEDPVAGYIPAYTVIDFSGVYKIKNYAIKAGINNLTNTQYFTRRADEYPGPGIIPAAARSAYIGFSAKF